MSTFQTLVQQPMVNTVNTDTFDTLLSRDVAGYLKPNTDYNRLADLVTPQPLTPTHHPVAHHAFISQIRSQLNAHGFTATGSAFELSHDGNRLFGVIRIQSAHSSEYQVLIGVRNAHDCRFTAELVIGSQVVVCSNLCFFGSIKEKRKHTRYVHRDLPVIVSRAMGKLGNAQTSQQQRIDAYRQTKLQPTVVNDTIIGLLDAKAIVASKIPHILTEYRTPSHAEFTTDGLSAWRLFNAVTDSYKGSSVSAVMERGVRLHSLLDTVCGLQAA